MLKISVITVCLNAEDGIRRTIESVLCQIYSSIEYIIIDGGSTDGTESILNEYKESISKLYIEKDDGVYDAMNKALEIASGDFILFMNAGDQFATEFAIKNVMKAVCDLDSIYYGDALFVDPSRSRSYIYGGRFSIYRFCTENICHQSIFYPRSAYKRYRYDLKYKLFADYVYNMKLWAKKYKFVYVEEVISIFRLDGLSSSGYDSVMLRDRGQIIFNNFGIFYYIYYLLKKNIRIRMWLKKIGFIGQNAK